MLGFKREARLFPKAWGLMYPPISRTGGLGIYYTKADFKKEPE